MQRAVHGWAEKDEQGYGYQDGLLVHVCEEKTGEQLVRIVVPDCRRRKVLQVSHLVSPGDISPAGRQAALKRTFTWPGVSKDVKIWCRACPGCQRAAKPMKQRAPLKPLSVISEPFNLVTLPLT